MALINIEYGAVASSETMNNNFSYLDGRITSSNNTINTNISSILSSIATINTNISSLSDSLSSAVTTINATIADYKNKVKLLVKNSGMVPNWAACRSITLSSESSYTADSNGYVLILPSGSAKGNVTVNNVAVNFKNWTNAYEYASEMVVLPVKSADVIAVNFNITAAYFLPSAEINVANF